VDVTWPTLKVTWLWLEIMQSYWSVIIVSTWLLSPSMWLSTLRAGVSSEGPQLELNFSVASAELWEYLYRNEASLPHITKPVSVSPVSNLHSIPTQSLCPSHSQHTFNNNHNIHTPRPPLEGELYEVGTWSSVLIKEVS